jgi:hypothetical protein
MWPITSAVAGEDTVLLGMMSIVDAPVLDTTTIGIHKASAMARRHTLSPHVPSFPICRK